MHIHAPRLAQPIQVSKLSTEQLAIISNKDVIAVNQDPLGVQAKKVAINGAALVVLVCRLDSRCHLPIGASYSLTYSRNHSTTHSLNHRSAAVAPTAPLAVADCDNFTACVLAE
jgi:hypothetical protein